jgi:hypothetical protein
MIWQFWQKKNILAQKLCKKFKKKATKSLNLWEVGYGSD